MRLSAFAPPFYLEGDSLLWSTLKSKFCRAKSKQVQVQ